MKEFLKAIWQFCSYLFWPQWGKKKRNDEVVDKKNAGQSD